LAQAIRETKGLATAIMLALAGFGWNKIESCMDQDFNRNVQRSTYEVLQPQIVELRADVRECVIGLEVWKKLHGMDSMIEDMPDGTMSYGGGGAASAEHPMQPADTEPVPAPEPEPEADEEDECQASDYIPDGAIEKMESQMDLQVQKPPSFDDIVKHVKAKQTPLNMQKWDREQIQEQAQEQFQDEAQ